jgi:hypothetical protein
MPYFGIKNQGEALHDPPQYIQQPGAKTREVLDPDPRVRVVLESTKQVRTGRMGNTFCLMDGPPFFRGPVPPAEKEASTHSHAEAVARAWDEHGIAFLNRQDITTSLVLWDASTEQLILARAQNGVPPIFFAERQDALLWSNSIKMLLRHGVEAKLNRRAG